MIYLVRHGQAAASWGEHPDPGLSALGQDQANAVARTLSECGVEHAFTSPMQRCQETGAPFAELSNLPLKIEPRVTEIPTPTGIDDRVSWLRSLMAGEWDAAPPVVHDWRNDLLTGLSALPDHSVVFTHFVAINAIVGHLESNAAVTVFRPNYCSITTLTTDQGQVGLNARGESLETRVL